MRRARSYKHVCKNCDFEGFPFLTEDNRWDKGYLIEIAQGYMTKCGANFD